MANRYFGGNSLAAFFRSAPTIVESTQSGWFNSAFVSSGLTMQNAQQGADYIQTPNLNPITGTVWLRFDYYKGNGWPGSSSFTHLVLLNAGVGVFRILTLVNSDLAQASYWNGTAWVNTGTTFNLSQNTLHTTAIKIVLGSGFELYNNGLLVTSGSGWVGGLTAVTVARYGCSHSVCIWSQVMIADYDLRDSHLKDPLITGNSAVNVGAASGVYTDVNETVMNDSTAINIQTSGNKAGQTKTAISLPQGYVIGGMVVNARGRVSGSGISDGKLGVRSGGTNYSSAALSYTPGYEPRGHIAPVDPATGVPFTQAGFNAAEPYLEAV